MSPSANTFRAFYLLSFQYILVRPTGYAVKRA